MRGTDQERPIRVLTDWKVALIFAAVSALYFFTRSPFLDEWDSVQFALGIREFNLWKHQPHPPGYPLYIFFGWCGTHFWNWDPQLSLHVVSCFGGALFVTVWFVIVRNHFGERFAWLIAGSLVATVTIWMTSTQVLTDMPAAGVLSAQLLCALTYRTKGRWRDLLATALVGAAATGMRPQLFGAVLFILLTPLWQRRAPAKFWCAGILTLIGACFIWLAPTCYLQAKLTPELSIWSVYPAQLLSQWRYRLDKSYIYIGASDFSPGYFALRFVEHILGWFGIGFGLLDSPFTLVAGSLIILAGLVSYFRSRTDEDRSFWKMHTVWLPFYILIIFCCLPANQRYYLIVYPFLLVAILRGFVLMPKPWRPGIWLLPALLLFISLPLALQNHRDDPPPIKFVRYLTDQYPAAERSEVVLLLRECQRHIQWYAPEFTSFYIPKVPFLEVAPNVLAAAKAIYTDDAALALPSEWRLVKVAEFHRSSLIELKQRNVTVYRVERMIAR